MLRSLKAVKTNASKHHQDLSMCSTRLRIAVLSGPAPPTGKRSIYDAWLEEWNLNREMSVCA